MTRVLPKFPEHFCYEEMVITAHRAIDNTPPPELVPTICDTAWKMDFLRSTVLESNTVIVTSSYRCEKLENAVCWNAYKQWCANSGKPYTSSSWNEYFERKAHPRGYAVDFICPRIGPPSVVVERIKASSIKFDQLIVEASWTHISFDPRTRMMVFAIP